MPDCSKQLYLPGVTFPRARQFISGFAVLATLLLVWSCAQVGAPQGGPADTTPPVVDLTHPASGDVLVARDAVLSVHFSEPIDKNALEGNLQLAPPRAGAPEYKWSEGGRRVEIIWPDSLRDSTTYRVTVSNSVTDRRGNKFAEPYTFAFSTGVQLDRGEIRGLVRSDDPNAATFDVYAYRLGALADTFWLSPPDYFTRTGADGRFQLPFLRAGDYRLLVLVDGDRNKRLDHGEQFALASRDFPVSDELPPDSNEFFPMMFDTLPFSLRGCAAGSAQAIALSFSHPLDTSRMSDWRIAALDSASGQSVETEVLKPTKRRANAVTLFGPWVDAAVYTFSATGVFDQRGRPLDSAAISCLFTAPSDLAGPKIEEVILPSTKEALSTTDPIVWIFSEPIDTVRFAGGASVRDSAGTDIVGGWRWNDRQTLTFVPTPSWPDTIVVMARIDSTRLADLAGNLAGAGAYNWRFVPLSDDDLGAIDGRLESKSPPSVNVWLEIRGIGSTRRKLVPQTAPGPFSLVMPAGRWQLGGFIDADADGRWFPGRLDPFQHAEPRMIANDTIDVRARFTLEDIVLRY